MTTRPKKYRTGPTKGKLAVMIVGFLIGCAIVAGAFMAGGRVTGVGSLIVLFFLILLGIYDYINSKDVSFQDREDWQRNRVDKLDFDDKNVK